MLDCQTKEASQRMGTISTIKQIQYQGGVRPRTHVSWCFTALVIKLRCHSAWPFNEMYCTSSVFFFFLQMFLQWLMSFYELIYILCFVIKVFVSFSFVLFMTIWKSILANSTWKKNTQKKDYFEIILTDIDEKEYPVK